MWYPEKKHKIAIAIFIGLLLCTLFPAMEVRAGEPSLPPHLIQAVSSRDIYEGLVALNMTRSPVLEQEDLAAARSNVENSVVRLIMGKAYGSGVIFRLTTDGVIIATNRHVLQYWDDAEGIVWFPQGFFVSATLLGSSEDCDVGFLQVSGSEFTADALLTLRSVSVETEANARLGQDTEVFCLGADREMGEMLYQEAVIENASVYIEAFDSYMLYGRGFAREGMSGGGIFDGYGYLVGLLAGGTDHNEIAGVPAGDVLAAYQEIVTEEAVR